MTLISADLQWFKSATGASAGGAISGTQIVGSADNNLWSDITDVQATAGGTRYCKVFLHNASSADTMVQPVVWISTQATSIAESIGMGFNDSDDDESTGGVITAMTANAVIQLLSDGSDTRQVDVVGQNTGGNCVTERVTLTGTTPVVTATTFSTLLAVHTVGGPSVTRTITFKQGAGGTVRGTIPPNLTTAWLWLTNAFLKANGLRMSDLTAGTSIGVWRRQVWSASTGMVRPDPNALTAEEA